MVITQTLQLFINHEFNTLLNYNILMFYSINKGLENNILNIILPVLTDFGSLLAWGVVCALLYIFGGVKNSEKLQY